MAQGAGPWTMRSLAHWGGEGADPPAASRGGRTRAGEALIEGRMHGKAVLGVV